MSYSKDYKKRAVEYKDEGHTFKELREVFKIPAITYYDRKEKIGNGCYEKKDKLRRKRVIDREKLAEAVKEQPDAYLYELADLFGCTPQAVFYALKEMKITLKKRRSATQKSQTKREQSTARN